MTVNDLKSRLDVPEQHIAKAETYLKGKGLFWGDPAPTASERANWFR